MANLRAVSQIAHKYDIPYIYDAARWAENAYFIKMNEDGTVKRDVGVLLKVKQISCYGNDSYGGMSGRDIMALAQGLYESCRFDYVDARVKQCEYLAQGFYQAGIKGVVLPAGGHAVYINMDEFFGGKRGHNLPMRHFHAFLEPYKNE